MGVTLVLGALLKVFFELEIVAIVLKSIICIFQKRGSAVCRLLSYMTEPVIYPVRVLFSKVGLFSRLPIDAPMCASFILLSALNLLFETWF